MRSRRTGVAIVVAWLPGCILFTGSTSGYQLADAGVEASACEGAACLVSAGQCTSTAECMGEAGAEAGLTVCCVNVDVTTMSVTGTSCVAQACPGPLKVQLCAVSAAMSNECGGGPCVQQSCTFGGTTQPIWACGTLSVCTVP